MLRTGIPSTFPWLRDMSVSWCFMGTTPWHCNTQTEVGKCVVCIVTGRGIISIRFTVTAKKGLVNE